MTYYSDKDPYEAKTCNKCGEKASIYTGVHVKRTGLVYTFYHMYPCWEGIQND